MSRAISHIDTFQGLILALQNYWAEQGCVILQPYDMEMGAGTFHTATFLRALGPETWNAAYVQPSRRPKDGRYGENPNRLQHYYQFQVVLKPNPDNIQQLYLDSLKAIGIDTLTHDIRFVEDNWESPTLGAWGLGWEVWLNGMEVTQFTYFQQVGGVECYPVTGEITTVLNVWQCTYKVSIQFTILFGPKVSLVQSLMVMYSIKTKLSNQRITLNMPTLKKCLNYSISMKQKQLA